MSHMYHVDSYAVGRLHFMFGDRKSTQIHTSLCLELLPLGHILLPKFTIH